MSSLEIIVFSYHFNVNIKYGKFFTRSYRLLSRMFFFIFHKQHSMFSQTQSFHCVPAALLFFDYQTMLDPC